MAQKEELKLVYREGRLEKIELQGKRVDGLYRLIEGIECPSIQELRENYEVTYEYGR